MTSDVNLEGAESIGKIQYLQKMYQSQERFLRVSYFIDPTPFKTPNQGHANHLNYLSFCDFLLKYELFIIIVFFL